MDTLILTGLAVILLAIRLPSVLTRLGVTRKEKVGIVILSFLLIGVACLAAYFVTHLLPFLILTIKTNGV